MRSTENNDDRYADVLAWCRAQGPGPVMRGGVVDQPACRVLDVARSEPDPGARYPGQRRSVIYAEGATWSDCAETMELPRVYCVHGMKLDGPCDWGCERPAPPCDVCGPDPIADRPCSKCER